MPTQAIFISGSVGADPNIITSVVGHGLSLFGEASYSAQKLQIQYDSVGWLDFTVFNPGFSWSGVVPDPGYGSNNGTHTALIRDSFNNTLTSNLFTFTSTIYPSDFQIDGDLPVPVPPPLPAIPELALDIEPP